MRNKNSYNHDFVVLNGKCLSKYRLFEDSIRNSNKITKDFDRARIGFYYLVLELLFGITQKEDVDNCVTDTTFRKIVLDDNNPDLGVDAIYIDDEKKEIYFFNFKYHETLSTSSTTKPESEYHAADRFFYFLHEPSGLDEHGDDPSVGSHTLTKLKEINSLIGTNDYEYFFYFVSNDLTKLENSNIPYRKLRQEYSWLNFRDFNLADLSEIIVSSAANNNADIIVRSDTYLVHRSSSSSSSSYVMELPLLELVRLTSRDDILRERNYESLTPEELTSLDEETIDGDLLFDNVREYLGHTTFNKKIIETLEYDPDKFFLFNNGITITADRIQAVQSGPSNTKISLTDFQVVNGGQTLKTVYKYKDSPSYKRENLIRATVIVRIFETGLEEGLVNKISEYTNSQNAISAIDLRSVDSKQLRIEEALKDKNINYIRKRGHISDGGKTLKMEKLGQVLFAYHGYPERSGNKKRDIFSKFYDKIFPDTHELLPLCIQLSEEYFTALNYYRQSKSREDNPLDYFESKIYFIIYIRRFLNQKSVEECVELFEKVLANFEEDVELVASRKILKPAFKTKINEMINTEGGKIEKLIALN